MFTSKLSFSMFIFLLVSFTHAQTVTGKWKMVDDKNGKARSVVEIYEKEGKIYGKILELLNPEKKGAVCKKCEDHRKDKKVEGMVVIEDMEKKGDVYEGGQILNPDSGSFYRCKLWLDEDNPDQLHVRGYLAFFFRTQTWYRLD